MGISLHVAMVVAVLILFGIGLFVGGVIAFINAKTEVKRKNGLVTIGVSILMFLVAIRIATAN